MPTSSQRQLLRALLTLTTYALDFVGIPAEDGACRHQSTLFQRSRSPDVQSSRPPGHHPLAPGPPAGRGRPCPGGLRWNPRPRQTQVRRLCQPAGPFPAGQNQLDSQFGGGSPESDLPGASPVRRRRSAGGRLRRSVDRRPRRGVALGERRELVLDNRKPGAAEPLGPGGLDPASVTGTDTALKNRTNAVEDTVASRRAARRSRAGHRSGGRGVGGQQCHRHRRSPRIWRWRKPSPSP